MSNRDIVVSLIFTVGLFLYSWLVTSSLGQSCLLDKETHRKVSAAEFIPFDSKKFIRHCLLPKHK